MNINTEHEDPVSENTKRLMAVVQDLNDRVNDICAMTTLEIITPAFKLRVKDLFSETLQAWVGIHKYRWPYLASHDISIKVIFDRDSYQLVKSDALTRFIAGRFE